MQSKFYLPFLLTLLAGCSTDQRPTSSQAQVNPAPAPIARQPLAKATPAPPQVPAAPATTPARSKATKSPQPARPNHSQQWVRRSLVAAPPIGREASTSFRPAAHPTETTGAAPAATLPAPIVVDNDLRAFCAQAVSTGQTFEVRGGRDTVLLGRQGTRLLVPAKAFDVPAGSGPVHIEMREFYTTADIVLAGLGTRSGTDLLETGGMLHLYAVANGQTVHLRPGVQLLVQLPTQQQLPGMRLYEGVSADASHAPDWQLPGTGHLTSGVQASNPTADRAALGEWVTLHPPKKPQWPHFSKNNGELLQEFARLMPDLKADQARLRRKRSIGKAEQKMLRELSRANHTAIRHAIVLKVMVDSAGVLQKSELVEGDSVLGVKVLAAVRQLPSQHPASFISTLPHGHRTVSSARGEFLVLYARSGRRLVGFSWLLMDKQLQEELAKEAQRGRAKFARQFTNTSTPLTLEGGLYYELAADGLGWINCDRLLQPGPRIEFAVQAPDSATVVSLVFKGQRSILPSSRTEGATAIFEQVPDGAAATVVALRRENGLTYLATSDLSLNQAAQPALQFRPVTLDELRTELARL